MKKYKPQFIESSWSRIISHIMNGDSFAVILAYKRQNTDKENKVQHNKLRNDIRSMGYGYIEQNSGYSYQTSANSEEQMFDEESFFIPHITKKDSLSLCKKYEQESILFKDNRGFYMLFPDGKVGMTFKTQRDDKSGQITFDPKILKYAYSQLKKASMYQKSQKFAYVNKECVWIEECQPPSRHEAWMAINTGKLAEAKYVRIL